ncbi:conserved protein of unknown function precursor containing a T9SS type A C-terminal secretion signal. Putative glycoside hydrolase, family 18 [Tenacibaculum sp. 190524A02b]|uniref:glycosyl hydrolase family 18 protein n=1 Tax=Tenacibaculum vairaonense TaxID=3137860 RepID=UPI0032B2E1F6
MKKTILTLILLICGVSLYAQYQFPDCYPAWDPNKENYVKGDQVSLDGVNYEAKYYTTAKPADQSWQVISACGDGGLGADYKGKQRIIGYLPTWIPDYDIKNNFKPEVVTNLNISFLMFKQNNNNYNSSDFASIGFNERELFKVDSVLTDCKVLSKSRAKNVKVSVAVGGATDYAFLWLMTKYYNNDQKLEEIANLLVNYVNQRQLDGLDLDLECWWADPNISGTSDQGGRKRGDKWGGADDGPHPAAIGLTTLSKKLREKMPNKLITAAVFGTSWYGNNYDAKMADYMDWIGLMTYDFTGSWDKSPIGPHSSLYKVPERTYTGQSANDPIYSVQDALEYWMGIAEPVWNHAGGLGVKKNKLVVGVPIYGYDFSERKPAGSNGFKFVPYRKILEEFPNAATSYDPKDTKKLNGHIGLNGKNIYFDTPKQAGEKIKYSKRFGHQGVIVWELTQDANYNSSSSILKALNEANGNTDPINQSPVITWNSPTNNQVFEVDSLSTINLKATAIDSDGTVDSFKFTNNGTVINSSKSGNEYTGSFTPSTFGSYTIIAEAIDDKGAKSESSITFTVREKSNDNTPPVISGVNPVDNSTIEQTDLSAITLKAMVTDNESVSTVEFIINNQTFNAVSSNSDEYIANWTPNQFGTFSLKIKAADNAGLLSEKTVSFTVKEKSTGGGCSGVAAWEAKVYAQAGQEVVYNNVIYKNKWYAETTDVPGNSNVWEEVRSCDGTGGGDFCGSSEWKASKVYNKGDKVYYDKKIYEANWWTQNHTPGQSAEWKFISNCPESTLLRVYPTSVSDKANIDVQLEKKSAVKILLFDHSGKLVKTFVDDNVSKGLSTFDDNLSMLKNGLYIYKIFVNGKSYTEKIIKNN